MSLQDAIAEVREHAEWVRQDEERRKKSDNPTELIHAAMLKELDDSTLLAECERRGWVVYEDGPSGRMRIAALRMEEHPPRVLHREEPDAFVMRSRGIRHDGR